MDLIQQIGLIFSLVFNFIFSIEFVLLLFLFIIISNIVSFLLFYKKYIKSYKHRQKIKHKKFVKLNSFPLINFVIPAWKEGKNFKNCLSHILNLKYPNFKVIINVGGSEETIKIANSYRHDNRFTILNQKAGEGKLKAINDCLSYVSEGFIHLIDADILLTDDIIYKMVNILLEKDENLVVTKYRPYKDLESKDIVKYILLNRLNVHKDIFPKYVNWISANTLMKFNVIKTINKFSEKQLSDDGLSMGKDIVSRGFKIFYFNNLKVETYYPDNIKTYFNQNSRWVENNLFNARKNNKKIILKFFILVLLSFYLLTTPILFFFNFYLFHFGILIFLSMYLKKIRKILIFQSTKTFDPIKIRFGFYFKLIFYILLDTILNVMIFLEFLFYRKAYKKRKNLID